MIQEQENSPPQSSSSSNSDLNSIVSYDNDWKTKNLNSSRLSLTNNNNNNNNRNSIEKPLQRMKIAPPAPPPALKQLRNPNQNILKTQHV
jgi:hypothetical protein